MIAELHLDSWILALADSDVADFVDDLAALLVNDEGADAKMVELLSVLSDEQRDRVRRVVGGCHFAYEKMLHALDRIERGDA